MDGRAVESATLKNPAKGNASPRAGQDKEALEVAGAFAAKSLGIEPQPVNLRVFAERTTSRPASRLLCLLPAPMSSTPSSTPSG
ncbi:MAG: hypothetical protein U0790_12605 [Isosphaeraceae bacterium]